jgi:serine/threonine protein kinase
MTLDSGTRLAHYKILEPIGKGGMGEVYLAEDEKLERTVAIKTLPEAFANDAERMERFTREAKAASAIKHPGVAHIYEIGESDGVHFIAMEHVEGKTLASRLTGKPLETKEILDIAIQVADVLDEAHSRSIVHRDIKPGNLMLTLRGEIKVLDFGLAKITKAVSQPVEHEAPTDPKTRAGVLMGTLQYMSPEQAMGRDADAPFGSLLARGRAVRAHDGTSSFFRRQRHRTIGSHSTRRARSDGSLQLRVAGGARAHHPEVSRKI